ncbi:MAG: ribulose-phosphate 3-epimerase [Patescibacteria group bacterium]|nr:ribulose-phosphate 3-epimerase [Patescibacteria group bacterium]
MSIIPAVLPHSFEEMNEKLSRIEGITSLVQIDLCDGVFGLEKTWLPSGTEIMSIGFEYEFDLMVNDWRLYVNSAIALNAKRVVLHVDHMTDVDIQEAVTLLKEKGVIAGIAVSNDIAIETHVSALRLAKEIDYQSYAQVMGIARIGEQGQEFDETAPERIRALKMQIGDAIVQVDGAMNPENGPKVIEAGATSLVVGSYLFSMGEVATAYGNMQALLQSED